MVTKPTQAQIEATAMSALKNELEFQRVRNPTAAAGIAWAIEQIERLTAAAEQKIYERELELTPGLRCTALRDFIADTPISEPNDGWAVEVGCQSLNHADKVLWNEAIERCAQVADGCWTGAEAAIRIRALKDKP